MDWHVRWMLRRHGLPDIPEVRRLLRAACRKGWTSGAAPSLQEMCAIREAAVTAVHGGGTYVRAAIPQRANSESA